jgi:hypothetical protein
MDYDGNMMYAMLLFSRLLEDFHEISGGIIFILIGTD